MGFCWQPEKKPTEQLQIQDHLKELFFNEEVESLEDEGGKKKPISAEEEKAQELRSREEES